MVTASRIWLLPTIAQTQSRSAWEMAWAALAAQLRSAWALVLISVAIGDFNGDGKQDLAVANLGSGTVSIRLGQCIPVPTPTPTPTPTPCAPIPAGMVSWWPLEGNGA